MTEKTRKAIERHQEVVRMHEAGKTKNEIAQAMGYNPKTVAEILSGKGITAQMDTDVKPLVYAKPRKPAACIVNGKRYTDITPTFS